VHKFPRCPRKNTRKKSRPRRGAPYDALALL
jgi:hypothetical protein